MLTKPNDYFPEFFHEGYKKPHEVGMYGDKNINFKEMNMDNTYSNIFMGPKEEIEKLAKEITEAKYDTTDGYFIIAKWNDNGMSMLGTFQNICDFPLHICVRTKPISAEILSLATDADSVSGPQLVFYNLQDDFKERLIEDKNFNQMQKLLFDNLSPTALNDLMMHYAVGTKKLKM